jgi:hypothetical protein
VHRRVVRCVLRTQRRILRGTAAAALVLSLTACATAAAGAWTMPNASTTPGAIRSSDPAVVCVRGYSGTVRPAYDYGWRRFRVSVFRAYGIPHDEWPNFTLDHLVNISLGGAPEDLRNVWPEPKAEAKEKDEVEDALQEAACIQHTITLQAAQAAIARNWTATPVGLPAVREHHYAEDER